MAKQKIEFKPIADTRMHGVTATVGNRRVEVVRTDSCCGLWTHFDYIDDKMERKSKQPGPCRMEDGFTVLSTTDTTYKTAMAEARAFLQAKA